ncbi:protein LURP-one-related 10-like [Rutidosis leptorrhynchoides]|uniref:protein LURP-one-related 10-like n=1 Tax=Rutidosis leptorrhynchoides TaxID=125765 RepID=UPI003A992183
MAQPIDECSIVPVCVIGSQFVTPDTIQIIVDTNSQGNIVVTDNNHRIMLKVKPCDTRFHRQRLLLHADDTPIAMLRSKLMTEHKRWKVYKGDSKTNSDMIFSTKAAHPFQIKNRSHIHVFMANKIKERLGDFLIKGSWSKRNCTISKRDSSIMIASMDTMDVPENVRFVKDKFKLKVCANVDYAFIVALIAIVDAIKRYTLTNQMVELATDSVIEAALGGFGPS